MAYRDDAADVCEAPTAEGTLRVEFAPRHVRLAVASRSIEISDAFATIVEHHRKRAAKDKRTSIRIAGRVIVARDVPREDVGVWIEVEAEGPRAGMRRIFGVEPVNLLEPAGLTALAALDRLAQRLRLALVHLALDVRRAFEIGSPAAGGLDKVLVVDHGDRWVVYARRLFRDRARFVMAIHDNGRIIVRDVRGAGAAAGSIDPTGELPRPAGKAVGVPTPHDTASPIDAGPPRGEEAALSTKGIPPAGIREITVRSRYGITVVGDYIRFADPQGADLARVSIPWIGPEERLELARRIGQFIDREHRDVTAWPPRLVPDADPAR